MCTKNISRIVIPATNDNDNEKKNIKISQYVVANYPLESNCK